MVRGKIIGLKKTWLLRFIALLCLMLFVGLVCVCVLQLKIPNLWFYSFCISIGIYELARGFLFRFDSSIYFGSLLSNIGISGFLFYLLKLRYFTVLFISLSFILASLFTFCICKQKFHLVLSFSLSFVTIYGFLLLKTLISTPIFIAFVVPFLLQLIVSIILNLKKGI